jgi:hypothetical protein
MDFRHTERTQVKRPVEPPISLDAGRLDVTRAALVGVFVLGSLTVATGGAWVVMRATGSYQVNWLALLFGAGTSVVALSFGGVVLWVSIREWLDHRGRVQDWHAASLYAYEQLGAVETIDQVSEWELTTDNPAHVLVVALWVHQRLQEGRTTPYAVRSLAGPLFLAGRRVGEMSKLSAERMGQKFEQLGLVAGREERRAGAWVPRTQDEVVQTVLKSWR